MAIAGSGGDDVLYGGINDAKINGGPGDDLIYPGGGFNEVCGMAGNDKIVAGTGGGHFKVNRVMTRSS